MRAPEDKVIKRKRSKTARLLWHRIRPVMNSREESVQSLGNVKMKFVRAFSIEEMRKMV
jgi:hypothetical protein